LAFLLVPLLLIKPVPTFNEVRQGASREGDPGAGEMGSEKVKAELDAADERLVGARTRMSSTTLT